MNDLLIIAYLQFCLTYCTTLKIRFGFARCIVPTKMWNKRYGNKFQFYSVRALHNKSDDRIFESIKYWLGEHNLASSKTWKVTIIKKFIYGSTRITEKMCWVSWTSEWVRYVSWEFRLSFLIYRDETIHLLWTKCCDVKQEDGTITLHFNKYIFVRTIENNYERIT